jgi:outer membrane scaffolding protein for murein synthesis (MipA/OmpV family)
MIKVFLKRVLLSPFFILFLFYQFSWAQDNLPPNKKPNPDQTQQKSKWALGLGLGYLNDYPASKDARFHYIIYPVYRGTYFKIDRVNGVSGQLMNSNKIMYSWNFNFNFPTQSKDIPVRQGMPDLSWLFSIGPEIKFILWQSEWQEFFLKIPIRYNLCTNFLDDTRFCGISFNPGFRHNFSLKEFGEFTLRAEIFIESSEYQRYYFEVKPEFATANRRAFHAQHGYLGAVYGFFHSIDWKDFEVVSAFNVYDYEGSRNQSSPLFEKRFNWGIFIGVNVDL